MKHLPWLCPVCRGICNCSCVGCQRLSNGLEKTGQMHYEAYHLGYDSVRCATLFLRAAQLARPLACSRTRIHLHPLMCFDKRARLHLAPTHAPTPTLPACAPPA